MDDLIINSFLAEGAEAFLYLGKFMGIEAVIKVRARKTYRAKELDKVLRIKRTALEAKVLHDLRIQGLHVPALLYVDVEDGIIVMERIKGALLKDLIIRGAAVCEVLHYAGREVGKMHSIGIMHGDLTTSNILVVGSTPYMIDFGLAKYTKRLEDIATDIHLFIRSVEATHYRVRNEVINCFMKGYFQTLSVSKYEVMSKIKEIRMRGRYVEERRSGSKEGDIRANR